MEEIPKLTNQIIAGDRLTLSRAITLIESTRPGHQHLAIELLKALQKAATHRSLRIAVSGAPGVGKSSFIDRLGIQLVERGKTVAVLAIDPTSQKTSGSILGDKTRMERLSKHPKAYVRPSASAGKYGGISPMTHASIKLCEASGYDYVFIETVGTGQSEIDAKYLCDRFFLLLQPGAGDDLQGIKKGIMEVADVLILTKDDGDLSKAHRELRQRIQPIWRSLHPQAPCFSFSVEQPELVDTVAAYLMDDHIDQSLIATRADQDFYWFRRKVIDGAASLMEKHLEQEIVDQQPSISNGSQHYLEAAQLIINQMKARLGNDEA